MSATRPWPTSCSTRPRRVRAANPKAIWCCDPVLGDVDTGIYVKPGIDTFFRERAIPAADLVTPNHFELEHLTGRTVSTMGEALAAARSLLNGPRLALITSLRRADAPADQIEMVAVSRDAAWRIATPLIGFDIAPNGTGDAVAALFSAHWIESGDVALALGKAASSIFAVLEATQRAGRARTATGGGAGRSGRAAASLHGGKAIATR